MRVLHLVTRDVRRGAETAAAALVGALNARDVTSSLVALAPAPAGSTRLGVPVLGPTPLHPQTLWALRRRASAVDLVVAHGSSTLPACRLTLFGSVPFVYQNIGDPLAWANTTTRRRRVRWMLSGARGVAALTERSRQTLVDTGLASSDKVTVVGVGHDESRYVPATGAEREAARTALEIPVGALTVGIVAALTPEKRVHLAVSAVTELPETHLVVIGDGPLRAEVERSARRSLGDRVHFLGAVDDVRQPLSAVDVLILTSSTEGLPGALVEAALMEIPAVATNVGYVADVVIEGITGRLVTAASAGELARALVETASRRGEMGPAARQHCVTAFSLRRAAARWESLLHAVLDADA